MHPVIVVLKHVLASFCDWLVSFHTQLVLNLAIELLTYNHQTKTFIYMSNSHEELLPCQCHTGPQLSTTRFPSRVRPCPAVVCAEVDSQWK